MKLGDSGGFTCGLRKTSRRLLHGMHSVLQMTPLSKPQTAKPGSFRCCYGIGKVGTDRRTTTIGWSCSAETRDAGSLLGQMTDSMFQTACGHFTLSGP